MNEPSITQRAGLGLALMTLLGGCVAPELEDARVTERAVIGGSVTSAGAFAATGALLLPAQQGGGMQFSCTATLIAPDVVLTAAHCVKAQGPYPMPVPSFTLKHDATAVSAADIIAGVSATPHPQFAFVGSSTPSQAYDIAIVKLSAPVPGVTPAKLVRPIDATMVTTGAAIDIVGYGLTSSGGNDYGVKHDASTTITQAATYEFIVGGSTQPKNCQGDSGGPAFQNLGGTPRIVGVVSRSAAQQVTDCSKGGIDTRVDPYLSWIHSQVTNIPCGSGLSEACATTDVDAGPSGPGAPDAGNGNPADFDAGAIDPGAGGDAGEGVDPGDGGGCNSGTGGAGLFAGCLALLLVIRRRRTFLR